MHIHLYPHPILTHPCKPLKKVDQFIKDSISEMLEFVYGTSVGLAASQVGLPYAFFVTKIPQCPVVINPVIHGNGGLDNKMEGCLSIPQLQLSVRRNNKVKLTGYDVDGNDISLHLEGLDARIIQHEYDHTLGRLFIDRAKDVISNDHPILQTLRDTFEANPFDRAEWEEQIKIFEQERC